LIRDLGVAERDDHDDPDAGAPIPGHIPSPPPDRPSTRLELETVNSRR
jgi:hypothetical protein